MDNFIDKTFDKLAESFDFAKKRKLLTGFAAGIMGTVIVGSVFGGGDDTPAEKVLTNQDYADHEVYACEVGLLEHERSDDPGEIYYRSGEVYDFGDHSILHLHDLGRGRMIEHKFVKTAEAMQNAFLEAARFCDTGTPPKKEHLIGVLPPAL